VARHLKQSWRRAKFCVSHWGHNQSPLAASSRGLRLSLQTDERYRRTHFGLIYSVILADIQLAAGL